MLLTEQYIKRLKELAGIQLDEVSFDKKMQLFSRDSGKFPFSQSAMIEAIKNGAEIGISYQSSNEKYNMPVSKYRIIHPVSIGTNKKGNIVVRAIHITGQSEKKAIETGIRSAEAENEWRMFNVKNIKNMWFTGRYFLDILQGYKKNDSYMRSVLATFDKNEALKNQNKLRESGLEIELA